MSHRADFLRVDGLAHAEYADAAVVPVGAELMLFAGVCPLDGDGTTVAPGDVRAQTRAALHNLELVLTEADAVIGDVALVRILVATTRRDDLSSAWAEFRAHFGDHQPPATLLGVTVLGYPDQLIELEVTAVRARP